MRLNDVSSRSLVAKDMDKNESAAARAFLINFKKPYITFI